MTDLDALKEDLAYLRERGDLAAALTATTAELYRLIEEVERLRDIMARRDRLDDNGAYAAAMNTVTLPLPTHISFELRHNPHKPDYMTLSAYLDMRGNEEDWISDEQREKALAADELWEAQWFPATPIGSCTVRACDLSVLLAVLEKES